MTDSIPQLPDTPAIWAVCNYPAGSGGANAFNGTAKLFAARTGLELHSIDAIKLIADFKQSVEAVLGHLPIELRPEPEASNLQTRTLLQRAMQAVASEVFFRTKAETIGHPQALLMSFDHRFIATHRTSQHGEIHLQIPERMFLADQLDIMHWCRYLPPQYDNLAPHHLSVEELAEEAARFRQALKGDGKPLIAIVLGQDYISKDAMAGLSAIANQFPDARFVVSTSPRTYLDILPDLREFRSFLNEEQQKQFVFYDFHAGDKTANPYKALLTLADHMIIIGQSESMVSERLFAGRTVHYGYGYGPSVTKRLYGEALTSSGKVKFFPHDGALSSEQFTPIDSTRMVVDNLIASLDARMHAEAQPWRERWRELETTKIRMRCALPASMLG